MARKRDWLNDDTPPEYRRFRHHKWPREYAGQPIDSYYQEPNGDRHGGDRHGGDRHGHPGQDRDREHERRADERTLKYAWQSQDRAPKESARNHRTRGP